MSFVALADCAQAQVWELHIAAGKNYSRLLNRQVSTPRSSLIRYGFGKGRLYFSPEVNLKVNENTRFSIGYQISGNDLGVQFLPNGRSGPRQREYDIITLHNFSVGYSYRSLVGKGSLQLGWFAKAGIAYGQMTAIGGSGTSGIGDNGGYYMGSTRLTEFEVMPDFWAPTTSVGFTVGPNAKGRRIADRLTFNVAASVAWKNPYTAYSKTQYSISTSTGTHDGIAQYQGMPLSVQMGADYSLFRFKKKKA